MFGSRTAAVKEAGAEKSRFPVAGRGLRRDRVERVGVEKGKGRWA